MLHSWPMSGFNDIEFEHHQGRQSLPSPLSRQCMYLVFQVFSKISWKFSFNLMLRLRDVNGLHITRTRKPAWVCQLALSMTPNDARIVWVGRRSAKSTNVDWLADAWELWKVFEWPKPQLIAEGFARKPTTVDGTAMIPIPRPALWQLTVPWLMLQSKLAKPLKLDATTKRKVKQKCNLNIWIANTLVLIA